MSLRPTSDIPDFSQHSQGALQSALNRINREKFPAHYEACAAEIAKRKAEGRWQAEGTADSESEDTGPRHQFPLIRRALAAFVDYLVGMVIALLFFPFSHWINLSESAAQLGATILSFTYFLLLEGPVGGGQTFGKSLVYLRVIGPDGAPPTWALSFRRCALWFAPVLLISILVRTVPNYFLAAGLGTVLFALAGADLICLAFHPQRRTIVDLLSRTLVQDIAYPRPEFVGLSKWTGRWMKTWVAVLVVTMLASLSILAGFKAGPLSDEVKALNAELAQQTNLQVTGTGIEKLKRAAAPDVTVRAYAFSMPSRYLVDAAVVREQTAKARAILLARLPEEERSQPVTLLIQGQKFVGFFAVSLKYRDPDLARSEGTKK